MTEEMIIEGYIEGILEDVAGRQGMDPGRLSSRLEKSRLPNGDIRIQVEIWDDEGEYVGPKRVEKTIKQLNG